MVVDDLECDLIRAGYIDLPTQSPTVENDSNILARENNWQLLFPEVVQDQNNTNLARNNLDGLTISHDRVENNGQELNNNNNNKNNNNKEFSNLSDDSSSEDIILIDHNRITGKQLDPSTSNAFLHAEDDRYVRTLSKNHSSSSDDSSMGHIPTKTSSLSQGLSKLSPMRKPPLQIMHKGGEEKYDPQRIPSSVFERCDSLIPAEWSVTSTESLFSLHVGNASIGREQALLSSGELPKHRVLIPKSQEFAIEDLHDISTLADLPQSIISDDDDDDDLVIGAPTLSMRRYDSFIEGESDHEVKKLNTNVVEKGEEVMKKVSSIKFGEESQHKQKTIHSSSISLHSNASEDSNYSFAFPVFVDSEKNALAKGSYQHPVQQNQQQEDIKSPSVALEQPITPLPRRRKGFLNSCFRIFCCSSCCHCPACSSCISCSSCTCSCPTCAFCGPYCISYLACIIRLISCSPCKTCWRNGNCCL